MGREDIVLDLKKNEQKMNRWYEQKNMKHQLSSKLN